MSTSLGAAPPTRPDRAALSWFAGTLFLSAFLLFAIQPMFAKLVLPRFGGAPAVWNTTMVFFQAMLLAGYLYAHLSARYLRPRTQALVHGCVLAAGFLVLPLSIAADWSPPPAGREVLALIALLSVSIGPPVFAISATAPLLQQWFAHTDHPAAGDPYFLYGGSNLGSMVALLSYPVLIEPAIGVSMQGAAWTAGYALLAVAIVGCATIFWRRYRGRAPSADTHGLVRDVTWVLRLGWLLLALVPSALLIGTTLRIGSEIAAVPFLWVIPLALYLLSFILVFARRPLFGHAWMLRAQIVIVAALAGFYVIQQLYVLLGLSLAALFVTSMVCHGELARLRPQPARLTEFYLWLSIGGVAGGILAAIVAPLVFNGVYEYPIAIIAALLLRPPADTPLINRIARRFPVLSRGPVAAAGRAIPWALDVALPLLFWWLAVEGHWRRALDLSWTWVVAGLRALDQIAIAEPLSIAYQAILLAAIVILVSRRPVRLGLTVAVVVAMLSRSGDTVTPIARIRTFFGVYSVVEVASQLATFRFLYHGRINHGGQIVGQPRRATTYYTVQGPVGQFFLAASRSDRPLRRIAITGLGAGALACQVPEETAITYFEIDPEVERIARSYFDTLTECGRRLTVEIGDGRLSIEKHPDGAFDAIVLDAFSGDAIPTHLLTREAIALYLRKLSPGGWILVHTSNLYLDLGPVLAATVRELGLSARTIDHAGGSRVDYSYGSTWVVIARRQDQLNEFDRGVIRWPLLDPAPSAAPWTDDFSNLFRALRWNEAGVFAP